MVLSNMTSMGWRPSWQQQDVEIKEINLEYNGFYQLNRLRLRHKCFSGEWSSWLIREQIRRVHAAAVLLYDPNQDKVVLVEQFRVGMIDPTEKHSPWLLEIVAGLIDDKESAHNTARREAEEEAGCHVTQLFEVGEFYNTPGGFNEKTTVFCGICEAPATGGIHGIGHEHEDIRVHVLPSAMVLSVVQQGKFVSSAATIIALQWLAQQLANGNMTTLLQAQQA